MISYSRLGSEITVNTSYARSQAFAEVTLLADGRFVISWLDFEPGTSVGSYVRLQVYEADGTPRGGETTVAGPLNGASQPTVTGLAGGGYVVAWDSSGGTKAQVYDSAGAPAGTVITLVANWGGNHADIAALADGGFAVAWHDDRTTGGDTSGSGVHLRTFDASGAATSADLLVNTTTPGDQHMVSVGVLAGGDRVVTWFDDAVGAAPNAVRAQIFDAAGAPVGGEITVSASGTVIGEAYAPVTALANGNFAIAWFQLDAAYVSSHRVQIFSATGERIGDEIVAPSGSGSETGPALAALADGSLAVAWIGYEGSATGRAVFVQVFDVGGEAVGEPMLVNTQNNGDQTDPSIAALDDGGFVVTWTDRNGAGADDDQVMAQVFGRSGSLDPVTIGSNGGGETAAVTLAENGVAVAVVEATGGLGALDYTIAGGADAARFAIDAETGALSFTAAPDFEAPADADGDNVYEVVVAAGDGVRSDTQALSITVGNVNEAPAIVSDGGGASATLALEEGATVVTTVAATDIDGDAVVYAIAGGVDAALFAIDAETGALSFLDAPDYDAPDDADADNVYEVTVSASDGALDAVQALAIAVEPRPFTFLATEFDQWENYPEVVSLVVDGADEGEPIAFTITGGADAALFQLDPESGQIYLTSQDFEAPADAGGDNLYEVEVTAQQGTRTVTASLEFGVFDVDEAAALVSGTEWAVDENGRSIGTLVGFDPEGSDMLRYFVAGGADGDLFAVNRDTGEFGFLDAPDFELPGDADGDNVYELEVGVTDGDLESLQTIRVTVADVHEPLDFAETEFVAAENGTAAAALGVINGTEPASYAIAGGADAALFALDATTGALSFLAAPDFEAWADADGDNVYEVEVAATAGAGSTVATIRVALEDVNEPFAITSPTAFARSENLTTVGTITVSDPENGSLNFTIVGGVDAARFAIGSGTGMLYFHQAPNFEAPADAGHDNVYDVIVEVSDGEFTANQAFTVTVGNVGEAAIITSGGGGSTATYSVLENSTAVATIAANDPDGGAVIFSLAGGADAARFAIDATTGALSFVAAPDYEAPFDANGDNRYQVTVSAGDGALVDTQALTIVVANAGGVTLTGISAADTLTGTAENDTLSGLGGNDVLDGSAGADELTGGSGADQLTGGLGADEFVYAAPGDSASGAPDRILDFNPAQGDKIDLSAIDARTTQSGNQAFTFIGTSAFNGPSGSPSSPGGPLGSAGQLRYFQSGGDTIIQGDVNGDRVADFQIVLDPLVTLSPSAFVL